MKKITMSKKEFVKEHKELVPKLKKAGLRNEARKQQAEMKRRVKR